jgi:acyl carrier protein
MNRDQIVLQVNAVLHEGFGIDPDRLQGGAHLYHDLGIDSLDAIDMLVYIEERIGRTIDGSLFKNIRRVSDLYDVMEHVLLPAPASAQTQDLESPVPSEKAGSL